MRDPVNRRTVLVGLVAMYAAPSAAAPDRARGAAMPAPMIGATPLAGDTRELLDALRARRTALDAAVRIAHDVDGARAADPAERSRRVRVGLQRVDAETSRIERIATRLGAYPADQLAAGAGNAQECAALNRLLYEAGYFDASRMAESTRGQFRWNRDEIAAALARGRAATARRTTALAVERPGSR